MPLENVQERGRHAILDALELTIDVCIPRVRLDCLIAIEFYELVGYLADGDFVALLQSPAPERLQHRPQGCAFDDFLAHNFRGEEIARHFPPTLALVSTAYR